MTAYITKIGVLSDTHLLTPDPILDMILDQMFRDMDMILHAGDIVSLQVFHRLEERGVVAVCGNMDDFELQGILPPKRVVSLGTKRIGLMHGWGAKDGLAERIHERFAAESPDVIVFGHSHVPFFGKVSGTLMFNPGAAARNRYGPQGGTVGVVEIVGDAINGIHIPIDR